MESSQILYYLAYGSNLHPVRLQKRVPSADFITVVELSGYQLQFHKKSKDGSGKCNLVPTGNPQDKVYAAVYKIFGAEKKELDKAEAGYVEKPFPVKISGRSLDAFTYFAVASKIDNSRKPYHWYKNFVLEGARYHGFPQTYIDSLQTVTSTEDPCLRRAEENQERLK